MKRQVFTITNMHCTSCAMNIDGELEEARGVQEATTNFARHQTVVVYNENQISDKQIIDIIKEVGYTAVLARDN